MKKNKESSKDKLNRLRIENELKKKYLTDEYDTFIGSDKNIPPELERLFLDSVIDFEKTFQSFTRIKMYDYLGQPAFCKVDEIADDEIALELDKLLELLKSKSIILDTICEVDDRELYRFITEELFYKEEDGMVIPGMMTHYTYEEFHPNHDYDIRQLSNDFVTSYLDKESDNYTTYITSEAKKADWHLHFRDAFSNFQLNDFNIKNLEFDAENAVVQFYSDFMAKIEGSSSSLHFLGEGEIRLIYQWDFWCVDSIQLPQSTVL